MSCRCVLIPLEYEEPNGEEKRALAEIDSVREKCGVTVEEALALLRKVGRETSYPKADLRRMMERLRAGSGTGIEEETGEGT